MVTVTNKDEAREFFITHSEGEVLCKKGDKEKEVDCYPDAVTFFDSED